MITFKEKAGFNQDATIVLITPEQLKKKSFPFVYPHLKNEILTLSRLGKFSAESGEIFPLVLKGKTILLVGIGKDESALASTLCSTLRKAFLSPFLKTVKTVEVVLYHAARHIVRVVIEAFLIGTYSWKKYLPTGDDRTINEEELIVVAPKDKACEQTVIVCAGVNFARNLVNDNADTVNSSFIEQTILKLINGQKNISTEILNESKMKAKGLNLHLAVNKGSRNEPKLIIVKYNGAAPGDRYTALIGKGITFDTGGLNLKPTGYIETMRTDMSGAAAVIGTLKNAIELRLKKNILFVVGVAENVIGAGAFKPGDVFKSYGGKTVEIGNTDAEGRLVLADAIAYVAHNYKPARIIDIATLTGACVVALGHDHSGLMASDELLAEQLIKSAAETDDRIWRLPVYPELKEHIKSLIADIKNTGEPKGAAGACSAAEFLRQFTDDIPWAHLDIAGTAFVSGTGRLYYGHGATGVGVRLLTDFIQKN